MPTKISKHQASRSHAALVAYIKMSPTPVPVYYERCVLKVDCDDDSRLIGVFDNTVTIEDLRYNAGIGKTAASKKIQKTANKVRELIGRSKNTQLIEILTTAANSIEKMA